MLERALIERLLTAWEQRWASPSDGSGSNPRMLCVTPRSVLLHVTLAKLFYRRLFDVVTRD